MVMCLLRSIFWGAEKLGVSMLKYGVWYVSLGSGICLLWGFFFFSYFKLQSLILYRLCAWGTFNNKNKTNCNARI